MKLFKKMKDGGPDSTVTGYWLVEIKSLFSIVLLKFEGRSRTTYHTHAFDCISWLIKGRLIESFRDGEYHSRWYYPSLIPFKTRKTDFHKVDSVDTSWVLSIRGRWDKQWLESDENAIDHIRTLSSGRVVVSEEKQ